LYLLLAAAVAVPLLVHLLRRRIGTRVRFPATRYLARAERDHSRTLKLRNLLLMAIRVAIVAAVVLAAARPVARLGGRARGSHPPTAVAIVLDNSLSTSALTAGKPVLGDLRRVAHQVLASAGASDRVWLVSADGRVHGGSAAVIARELDAIQPLAGAGDPAAALARARALVRSSGLASRSIVLLTDGQRTTWQAVGSDAPVPRATSSESDPLAPIVWTPSAPPPANASVVDARAQPTRWTPRGALVARFASPDSVSYRLTLGGETMARGTAAPGEEVRITAAPHQRGWLAGTVELEPDELTADNTRHLAVWVGPATGVTALAGAGPFVASALDVLRGSERITTGGDVTVAAADEVSALPALILAPTDPSRVGVANRALQRLNIPWRFGVLMRDSTRAAGVRGAIGGGVDSVGVATRLRLRGVAGEAADTLATVGAEPWIVAGPHYVLVASPLTPDATTLPVSATFLPWLADVLTQRLSGEPGQVVYAAPGANLSRPRWADAMELANGSRAPLADAAVVTAPAAAGTYFLDDGGRRVGALVVNSQPEESVLQRFTAGELAARLSHKRARAAADGPAVVRDAYASGGRRSLLPALLAVALVLLLVEAWMTAGWRRAGVPA
jgi:hypothetical protein